MLDFKCATCGGDITPYGAGDLYNCKFCGKLYSENKEITHIEASRKLRRCKEFDAAGWLMEDYIAKEGESSISLRELLLVELKASSICGYIREHSDDTDMITGLITHKLFRRLKNNANEEEVDLFYEPIENLRADYEDIEKKQEELGVSYTTKKLNESRVEYSYKKNRYVKRGRASTVASITTFLLSLRLLTVFRVISASTIFFTSLGLAVGVFFLVRYFETSDERMRNEQYMQHCQMMEYSIDGIKNNVEKKAKDLERVERAIFEEEGSL